MNVYDTDNELVLAYLKIKEALDAQEMFTEEDVRTIYKNMDKFYFGSACGKEIMKAAKHENN